MIKPSVNDLSKNKYNRYTLCIAASKCARLITESEAANDASADFASTEKASKEPSSEKPLIEAIRKLYEEKYIIKMPGEELPEDAAEKVAEEKADTSEN